MDTNPISGTCLLMCPESEITMRQREKLVHPLECRPGCRVAGAPLMADRRRMVKMFSRSAAGKDLLQPTDLRPPIVLKKTINYLLSVVVCEEGVAWSSVYMFVADRLRSVRQDMTVQQVPPSVCCMLLEPIIRFYTYSSYRLCEAEMDAFDPHLNSTQLNECLKQLLVCYDSCEAEESSGQMSSARQQMEAIYGLLHLGNVDAIYRLLSLRPSQDSELNEVLYMSLARYHNDYVTVCRRLRRLSPLLACVAVQHLPTVRREALSAMNTAYNNKTPLGYYPLEKLATLLLYTDKTEAMTDCRHFGLTITDDEENVHFLKSSFDSAVKLPARKRVHFLDEAIDNINLPDLLLTVDDPEP